MKNILFIWYQRPQSIPNGGDKGSIKNYELCTQVVGADNVHSVYINNNKSIIDKFFALFLFSKGYYYGLTPSKVHSIIEQAMQYDCVFIDRSLFGIIARELKKKGYKGSIVANFHNVEKIYFDQAKLPKSFPFRDVIIRCADMNDRWSMQFSDYTIALNRRDQELLQKLYGRTADLILPVALRDQLKENSSHTDTLIPKKPLCLTIGAYFEPNNEGILWFVKNVLPHVDITYKIVGKDMHRLKAENKELLQNIEVISNAPSLTPYFEEADLMIFPIFSGSGMKVKTCESLMYGKHILGTTEALEGYEGDYNQIGALCNTAEEFIHSIQDYSHRGEARYNQYARDLFLRQYSYDAVLTALKKMLNSNKS